MIQNGVLDFIFRYRIHVSSLAFLMCFSAVFYHVPISDAYLISLSFASVISFVYLFNKVTDFREDGVNIKAFPIEHSKSRLIRAIAIFCALAPLPYLFIFDVRLMFFYLLFPGLFGFLYSSPLHFFGFKKRLKDLPYAKNFVSAILIWASIPLALRLLYTDVPLHNVIEAFMTTAVMIFIIEVIWDIRDIDGDLHAGIKTFPNQFGVKTAKIFCFLIVAGIFIQKISVHKITPGIVVPYVTTMLLILAAKKDSHAYLFQGIVMVWLVQLIYSLRNLIF